jgi:uncharacterized protein YbjQ (UPF0145 family)
MESLFNFSGLIIFLFLVCLGYGAGTFNEKRHYRSLRKREEQLADIMVMTVEEGVDYESRQRSELVTGSVVISIDYFKRLLGALRNIFGGRVVSYESLVERARREAILRMKEEAAGQGYERVVNLRLETAAIGFRANQKQQVGSVEAIAYGTALGSSQQ